MPSVMAGFGLPLSHNEYCCRLAVPAPPARDERRHHDPITHAVFRDGLTGVDHLAHELVAEHVTGTHHRDVTAQQVQVRTTGGTQPHLENDVVVIEDLRFVDVLDGRLVHSGPTQRLHSRPSPRLAWWSGRSASRRSSPIAVRATRDRP